MGNGVDRENVSLETIKSKKIEDVLDFVKANSQIRDLTKDLVPASISIQAGKDFVELKVLLAKPELADSIRTISK